MIDNDSVVSIRYTLKDKDGNLLDASEAEPLKYLHGHQNIIPALEEAVAPLVIGQRKQVQIKPEEGYGEYDPELKFSMPRNNFGDMDLAQGRFIQISSPQGETFMAQVISVNPSSVELDANHPLAGQDLYFDVELVDVRKATPEELAHGHVH